LPEAPAFAAIDLGAESGRVVVGRLAGGRFDLDVAHRFPNRPVALPDGLRWNLLQLFTEAVDGLRHAAGRTGLHGVGIDAWGVDYALLDEHRRMLGLPFHYRDRRTHGMIERAFGRVSQAELYAATGIQTLSINTVFQLLADEGSAALDAAAAIAFVPDLFALWLTGELANERTVASTSGLLDARSGEWSHDIIGRLGLPARPFGELVEPGGVIGGLLAHHADRAGLPGGLPVHAVASHDTASAFVAAPVGDPARAAILSSGTWSLLGVELDAPVLNETARAFDLTNERGIDGTTRLLKNVMGLWLVQECRNAWAEGGQELGYDELHRMASSVDGEVPLFDPDLEEFLAPGHMPARIEMACARTGQRLDPSPAVVVRATLTSLACKYRLVLERVERTTGRQVDCVHVIGGGSRNELLCQLTADVLGRPVVSGPVEATALGNLLVQARAAGGIADRAEMRAVARASAAPVVYEPTGERAGESTYRRFLAATGLSVETPAAATA
jgi:rhamnulokinase